MIKFTWKDIDTFSKELYLAIKKTNYKFEYVIGISRAGLIPATILANNYDCKLISISAKSYTGTKKGKLNIYCYPDINLKNKKVILIDEICDTGETMNLLKNKIIDKYQVKTIKTASLVINKTNILYYPDFYVKLIENKHNKWISFPWDKKVK